MPSYNGRMMMSARFVLALLLAGAPMAAVSDDSLDAFLRQTLEAVRSKHHIPAMAALVEVRGAVAVEAVGVRAKGRPELVTVDDRWHIGSDTKAFTATMIARLVERGVLSLDDNLARCLPDMGSAMNPAYR